MGYWRCYMLEIFCGGEMMAKWLKFEGPMPKRAFRENWVERGWVKKIRGVWYYKR